MKTEVSVLEQLPAISKMNQGHLAQPVWGGRASGKVHRWEMAAAICKSYLAEQDGAARWATGLLGTQQR